MPVYMIIEVAVRDKGPYLEYVKKVPAIVQKYGGRYLARGGAVTQYAGGWDPQRLTVIEFPSIEDWRACFESAEYRKIAPLREKSADTRAIVVEGC